MGMIAIIRAKAGRTFLPALRGTMQFYFSLLAVFGFVAEGLTLLSYEAYFMNFS